MRTISRCHDSSSGAFFSMKYSRFSCGSARQRPPQVVDLHLRVGLAIGPARLLLRERQLARPPVAVDAVVHQGMAGVEQFLDRLDAVAFLALGDVVLRVD